VTNATKYHSDHLLNVCALYEAQNADKHKNVSYGHVTVLKFCRLRWCSASRGFVSDSWATCLHIG